MHLFPSTSVFLHLVGNVPFAPLTRSGQKRVYYWKSILRVEPVFDMSNYCLPSISIIIGLIWAYQTFSTHIITLH